jgi:hypothetical protein
MAKIDGPDADKTKLIKSEFLMDPDNAASSSKYSHQRICRCSKAIYNCVSMGKIQLQTFIHGCPDCLAFDVLKNVMYDLVQDMGYVKINILS